MDCSFRFSLPLDLYPINPHISLIHAASLSLCTRFYPPISPGRRSTVHLDGAPTCRPPPLVCAFSPDGQPKKFLSRASVCFLLSGCPPFYVLDLRKKFTVGPRVLLSRGNFLPITDSTTRTRIGLPMLASTGGPLPCWSRLVGLCSLSPRPLRLRLALPMFRTVS